MRSTAVLLVTLILSGEAVQAANVVRASKAAQAVFAEARVEAARGVENDGVECADECSPGACDFCGSGLCCRQMHSDGGMCPGGFQGGFFKHVCIDPDGFVPQTITEKVNSLVEEYRFSCVRAVRPDTWTCFTLGRKVLSATRKLAKAQAGVDPEDTDTLDRMATAQAEALQALAPADAQNRLCTGIEKCDAFALAKALAEKIGSVSPREALAKVKALFTDSASKDAEAAVETELTKLPDDAEAVMDAFEDDDSALVQNLGSELVERDGEGSLIDTGDTHVAFPDLRDAILLYAVFYLTYHVVWRLLWFLLITAYIASFLWVPVYYTTGRVRLVVFAETGVVQDVPALPAAESNVTVPQSTRTSLIRRT